MTKTDDRPDPVSLPQHQDGLPALTAGVSATVVSWLQGTIDNPLLATVGGALSLAHLGLGFVSALRVQQQLDFFRQEFNETRARLGHQNTLDAALRGPEAEEAILVALRLAASTTNRERVRRLAQVVARTAASPTPIWGEAEEFIRALEQINDADLEAVNILWAVQRNAYRNKVRDGLEFSTDPSDYNRGWSVLLTIVSERGVSKDEWSSRCARLSGFGLAVQVPSNPSHQRTDDVCFRLTSRAARLLALLGQDTDHDAYPRVKYHRNLPAQFVADKAAEAALGPGWRDLPYE